MLWRSTKKRRDLPEGFIAPCVPTIAARPPAGPLWIHEIKQDGYRMIARRGEAVRLLTRNGHDWTKRYPRIVAAIESLPGASAAIDGEAVWLDEQGIGDFRKLHSRLADREVTFFAFDLLEIDGRDIRKEPLERRRALLRSILKRADIVFSVIMRATGLRSSPRLASSDSRESSPNAETSPMRVASQALAEDQESGEPSDA